MALVGPIWAALGTLLPAAIVSLFRYTMHPLSLLKHSMVTRAELTPDTADGRIRLAVQLGTGAHGSMKVLYSTRHHA